MDVIEMGRRKGQLLYNIEDKSVIMNHQQTRGNRFRAKPNTQTQLQTGRQAA